MTRSTEKQPDEQPQQQPEKQAEQPRHAGEPEQQAEQRPQQFGDPVEVREPDDDPIGPHQRRPDDGDG